MATRNELLKKHYEPYDEDRRLSKDFQGKLEYITTMHYIHKMVKSPNAKILEIGAGTGRYSIKLAKEGFNVSSVELLDKHCDILKRKSSKIKNIAIYQDDALDLSRFKDNTFSLTLSLGPMYHLYDKKDITKALKEAIRVTKPNGIIFFAFIPIHAIMYENYFKGNWFKGKKEYFTNDYKIKHFKEQIFTGFGIKEFEDLFLKLDVSHIKTVSADGAIAIIQDQSDFKLTDKEFKDFVNYHLHFCEERELLGLSEHCIYICKKVPK